MNLLARRPIRTQHPPGYHHRRRHRNGAPVPSALPGGPAAAASALPAWPAGGLALLPRPAGGLALLPRSDAAPPTSLIPLAWRADGDGPAPVLPPYPFGIRARVFRFSPAPRSRRDAAARRSAPPANA